LPSTLNVTPFGTAIGFLPILDIFSSLLLRNCAAVSSFELPHIPRECASGVVANSD
jgi:hypothetical protein